MGWLVEKKAVLGPDGQGETLAILLETNGYWWRLRAEHAGRKSDSEEFDSDERAIAAHERLIIQAFSMGWSLNDVRRDDEEVAADTQAGAEADQGPPVEGQRHGSGT